MHWILEKPTQNINKTLQDLAQEKLASLLKEKGIPFSFHRVIPFTGHLSPAIDLNTRNAICIGPYSMRHSAKEHGLYPGVFDIEHFDFVIQKQKWGKEMLNFDSIITSFNQLNDLNENKDYFIRPVDDSKCFAGNVFNGASINEWKSNVIALDENGDNHGTLNGNTLLQFSSVKDIIAEYRFWIVKGQVVAHSIYKKNGKVFCSEKVNNDVLDYVKGVIETWQPNEAFVIDIADTSEGFKIVEINTLNAAGFYHANIENIVDALEANF